MATYTVTSADYIRPYNSRVRVQTFKEGASQSFKKGYLLKYGSDAGHEERVIVVGADPTGVVGVAAQDATGTTDAPVSVWLPDDQAEFVAVVQGSQANDQTHIAAAGYGMVADGTNLIHRVDISETSAKVFKIVRLHPGTADADVEGRVIVQILPACRQTQV